MVALVGLFIVVVLVIGPAFALLFSLHGRHFLHAGDDGALSAAAIPGTRPLGGSPRQQPARPRPGTRNTVLALVAVAALVRAALRRRQSR